MSSNQPSEPTTQQTLPVELLNLQAQRLDELNRKMTIVVEYLQDMSEPKPRETVKIADINMPFLSLVGLIVKASIAAIPAYLIVTIFVIVPLVFLFSSCSAFKR